MAGENDPQEGVYADLGGIRIHIPAHLSPLLRHISKFHSLELEYLSNTMERSLEGNLANSRLGEGVSTVMAILRLSEDHLKDGKLVEGDPDLAREDLYKIAFDLLRGFSRE